MAIAVSPGVLGIATPFGELLGKSDAELHAELKDYAALGVDWIRTDIHWGTIQPKKDGAYDWTHWDKVFNAAAEYGIKIVGILNELPTPSWASSSMSTAAEQQGFVKFAAAAAQHFGDRVDTWEVMNEPNMHGISAANYTKMLKGAYDAIKAVDAGDTVISAGLAAVPSTGGGYVGAADYLTQIYANGGKDYFDAVGYHPYTYPYSPKESQSWNGWQMMESNIRSIMVANGDSAKQVWMTEFGAPTSGGSMAISQAEQADLLKQAVDLAGDTDWAGPIMWYSYQDRGGSTGDTENWFGLVGPNGQKKDAYYAYQEIGTKDDSSVTVIGGSGSNGGSTESLVPDDSTDTSTEDTGTSASKEAAGTTEKVTGDGAGVTASGTVIRGTEGADTIVGWDKANWITGGAGNDKIDGAGGVDRINGGAGSDVLTGGSGKDYFIFSSASDVARDRITDFTKGDKIDLSAIDADTTKSGNQSFDFIGSKWLADAADLGFYQNKTADVTHVQADLNGDGKYDFDLRLDGIHTLTASDFIL